MARGGAKRPDSDFPRPLAALKGERPSAPQWYRTLMAQPCETLHVDVSGASIEIVAWGRRGQPGILLAHGNRAHARWWGPVAPMLAKTMRVVSLSWSGMGGSDWRDRYSTDLQVEELFAAATAGGLFESGVAPVFAGHSFGARAVARAAELRGDELSGAILVDSAIAPEDQYRRYDVSDKPRRYATLADALARFYIAPPQPCENLFILDDVARAGLVQGGDGWRWRFDPSFIYKLHRHDVWQSIHQPQCPLGFIYGERSPLMSQRLLAEQRDRVPPASLFTGIPLAGHHIMFDQPVALTVAVRAMIARWLDLQTAEASGS